MNYIHRFLNLLSHFTCFLVVFSLVFIIQKYTLGFIPGFMKIVIFKKIYLFELTFASVSIFIIYHFFNFSSPYKTN